jgi:hypothetical protein
MTQYDPNDLSLYYYESVRNESYTVAYLGFDLEYIHPVPLP